MLNMYTRKEEISKNQWPYDTSFTSTNEGKSKHIVTRRKEIVRNSNKT